MEKVHAVSFFMVERFHEEANYLISTDFMIHKVSGTENLLVER